MEASEPNRIDPAVAAAQRLRIDFVTAEVLRELARADVPSILLKGPSLVRWLYEPGESRMYVDADLLVPPAHYEAAGALLASLGFRPEVADAEMPEWWRDHGVAWLRPADDAAVDLHRTLDGLDADPQLVWEALSRATEPIEVAGVTAYALALPARALHVALHAAQHGAAGRQADEVARAIAQSDEATWHAAAELARELGGTDAFVTGLRFAPAGAELAERMELDSPSSVGVALRAAGTVDGTLTLERFLRSGGRTRLSMLRYKLAPPPTFMRKWSPLARRGRRGLALAYVWRPVWVALRLPQTLRDWRAARRPR